jgi:hypothetical protein
MIEKLITLYVSPLCSSANHSGGYVCGLEYKIKALSDKARKMFIAE